LSPISESVEYLWRYISTGYTLEGLDAFGTLDALPASLDASLWAGGQISLAAFNSNHRVVTFTGTAKDAIVTTSEFAIRARKEGIIPGAANMRLPRFTGERIARQAIMYERRLDCDSPEGRLICDEIVEPTDMDSAIERVVDNFTGSGIVSAASNRRAFRVTQEPLDLFRRYFATYALEQAYCHFSPALISNLERHWNAKSRKL
jgi:thioesterase DpgC